MDITVNAKSEGFAVTARTGEYEILFDEAIEYGGKNKGPHPMQTVLASLASCVNVTATMIAGEMYFDLKGLSFDIKGIFDPFGVMGDTSVHPYYEQVTLSVEVETSEDESEIQALKEQVQARCPIYTLFKAAGVKMKDTWVKV